MMCTHRQCYPQSVPPELIFVSRCEEIFTGRQMKGQRGKAAQVCFGPADTADMLLKAFLMNPGPNTFPKEKSHFGLETSDSPVDVFF